MRRFGLVFIYNLGWILVLTALFPYALISQGNISVVHPSRDTLLISFHFPEPSIFEAAADNAQNQNRFIVPMYSENVLILVEEGSIDVQLVEKEVETREMDLPVIQVEDVPIGTRIGLADAYQQYESSKGIWEKRRLGSLESKILYQIDVYPHNLHSEGTHLQWIQDLILRVVGKGVEATTDAHRRSEVLRSFIENKRDMRSFNKPSSVSQINMSSAQGKSPRLKIIVDNEGMFIIPQPMITAAGWDMSGLNPHFLRVVGTSGEIPIRVVGEEDGSFDFSDVIEFWGEPLWDIRDPEEYRLDVFATQNVYWLELGEKNGLRLAQEEGLSSDGGYQSVIYPRSYPHTQHEEKDYYFHRLPYAINVDDGDHWFTAPPINGGTKREFPFQLLTPDVYATQLAKIRVKLRGQSESLVDHNLDIYLNDAWVASGSWRGNQALILESQGFSPTFLREGTNHLVVMNRSEEGVLAQLLLDWFEITYPRLYQAYDDYLRFKVPRYSTGKICRFQIEGFTEETVEVYKKGVSRIRGSEVQAITDSLNNTTYRVIFQDIVVDEQTEYIALTPSRKSIPDSVVFVEDTGLRSEEKGADCIIIVPSDSLGEESLGDLVALRQSQGLQVEVVKLDAIYDEFHSGIPNPEGIRQFLRYAYRHWSPPPRFVLLVGEGVVNNRLSIERGNIIPVPLHQTLTYGAAASDHWYTLLEGEDHIPELTVGRLPVGNRKELEAVVAKIVNYEQSSVDTWRNRYLLIGAGGYGDVFGYQSETLINEIVSPSFHPERLYLSGSLEDPYVGGTEDLLRYLRDGVALVNFRGHGGGAIWSDAGLLDLDDIELIENRGKLPVVTSMTCFTCDFTSGRRSLGEALVCQEEVGSVAIWGSTGLGWLWNDYYLLKELFSVMSTEPGLTLGEMLLKAKTSYLLIHGSELAISEVHQYTLLGDPATKLVLPESEIPLTLAHRALSDHEPIHVEGTADGESFNVLLELTGKDRATHEAYTFGFQQRDWEVDLQVPSDFSDTEGGIRAYIWDSQTDYQARGFIPFSLGKAFFDSLLTVPDDPSSRDSLRFSVVVEDPDSLVRVWCQMISPDRDTLGMAASNESRKYITKQKVGPFPPGTALTFSFFAENGEGLVSGSDTVSFTIPILPDLAVLSVSLGGTNQVFLQSTVSNFGEEDVEVASVRFKCPQLGLVAEDTVYLPSYEKAVASVPFSPLLGKMGVTVIIDPDTTIQEKNRDNNWLLTNINMDRFNVTPEEGSLLGLGSSDTVGLPGKVLCFVPPGAVPERTVLYFETVENSETLDPGMGVEGSEESLRISALGLSDKLSLHKEATLKLFVNSDNSNQSLSPYRWDGSIGRWVLCPYTYSDSMMIVKTKRLGLFRLLTTEDTEPPRVEIQVENQSFTEGSYVPRRPLISVVVEDESGVDIQPGKIGIFLDDEIQESSSITLPDSSQDPTSIMISFRPVFEPGEHTVSVKASDVHGNLCHTEKIRFRIGSQLEIQYLGNHPNPFRRETTFAYVLTDATERVSLKIYTVSGMLIRSFEDYSMTAADYHEILWDGKDEWGEDVANGVYFFLLKAEGSKVRREITGKIAKIR